MGNEYEKEAKTLNKLGDKMFKKKLFTDAMKYYIESVKMMGLAGNTKMAKKYQAELDEAISKKAEELNKAGDNALKNKEYEKAINIYDEAWKLLQRAGEKWINKKGKEFQKELKKSKVEFAVKSLKPEAEKKVKSKNWKEAVQQYRKIVELVRKKVDPKMNKVFTHDLHTVYERWADDLNIQGDKLYKKKNFEEAIEFYTQAVHYIEKSDNEKKIKSFKKELAIAFQNHAQEINNIGDRLWKEKNYAKAAEIYASSVKTARESGNEKLTEKFTKEMSKAYAEYAKQINLKGDKLFKEKKFEEASEIYTKSVERATESGDAKLVKKFTREYEKSMERWAKEVNKIGDEAMKSKKFDIAMRRYQESVAIIMRTNNVSTISNYTKEYHKACIKLADNINKVGDEKFKLKDFEKAFELYDKSVKLANIAKDSARVQKYTKERNKALNKMG
ncbi:MAG: hypothetical protein ACTSRK_04270 [Promethearchaeota archaeon]